jgi:hypothetical protein
MKPASAYRLTPAKGMQTKNKAYASFMSIKKQTTEK